MYLGAQSTLSDTGSLSINSQKESLSQESAALSSAVGVYEVGVASVSSKKYDNRPKT